MYSRDVKNPIVLLTFETSNKNSGVHGVNKVRNTVKLEKAETINFFDNLEQIQRELDKLM